MKPFYGIDRTNDKKNTIREGGCFIAAGTSDATGRALEQAAQAAAQQTRRADLPAALKWLRYGAMVGTLLLFFGVLRSLGTVTLDEAYENAPELFWIMGVSAVVWAVLSVIGWAIRRKARSTEEFSMTMKRAEDRIAAAYQELGVPADAKDVDLIAVSHRWKNGKMKPVACGLETSERYNEPVRIFVKGEMLCIADTAHRYEIPKSELLALKRVRKHLYSKGWNKGEPWDKGFYKPYKLRMDDYGRIHMNEYGLLVLCRQGVQWAVWLPPYELNYISALTGLPITEE